MYHNDFSIKEVNAYYARQGGIRTAKIHGYANVGSFSSLMQRAMAQAGRAAQKAAEEGKAADAPNTARTRASSAAQNAAGASARPASQSRHTADSQATTRGTVGAKRSAAQNSTAKQTDGSSAETAAQPASGSGNVCCEQCHATNQPMLQMMSRNLYAQSALNYPLSGYGSWTAYQNMANLLGNSLF